MTKQFTYRQKLRYLGIGAALLMLISYQFSFSKTLGEYKKYRQFQRLNTDTGKDENSYLLLQSRERMLDGILKQYLLDTADQSKNLLYMAGQYCKQSELQLTEYRPYPETRTDTFQLATRSITVTGGFTDCLKLLYYLETKTSTGRVAGVNYKTVTAPGNTGAQLTCTIFIQNLILLKNETD